MGLLDERWPLLWGAGSPSPPAAQDAATQDAAAYGAMGIDPVATLAPFSIGGPAPRPPDLGDIARSAGIGLASGTVRIAGMPAELATGFGLLPKNLLANGWLTWSGLEPLADDAPEALDDFKPGAIQQRVEERTGRFYQPKTTAGRYAETVGEFAPLIVGGGAVGVARGLGAVARGAGAAAVQAPLRELGGNLAAHAVVPGIAVQGLEDAFPDSPAGSALKKAYPLLRRGLPWLLAARRSMQ